MIRRLALMAAFGSGCVVQQAPVAPAQPATTSDPTAPRGEPERATAHVGGPGLTVPDFMGKTAAEAQAIAHHAGFAYDVEVNAVSLDCGDDVPRLGVGKIECQKPKAGQVVTADTTLYVSTQGTGD